MFSEEELLHREEWLKRQGEELHQKEEGLIQMEEELRVKEDEGHKKEEEVKVTINKSIINLFSQDINAASVNMLCVCVCRRTAGRRRRSLSTCLQLV